MRSAPSFRFPGFIISLFAALTANASLAQERVSPIPDFDPSGLVRFGTIEDAEARRTELIQYIWPSGLPSELPRRTNIDFPIELSAINKQLVAKVERLDCDVARFDLTSIAFRLHPMNTDSPSALFVVHAGHMREGQEFALEAGLAATIEFLLKQHCEVVVMQMPLVAWNRDQTLQIHETRENQSVATSDVKKLEQRGTAGHNEMFEKLEPRFHGEAFRLFLEPVVQVFNLFETIRQPEQFIGMVGLSGGGWTTHMAAAVDRRIDVSIPVAGAMPLYAREFSPGSRGDHEQFHAELYGEKDSNGDEIADQAVGVASWLEIFALGGMRQGDQSRRQVQVLNYFDSCCFSGPIYKSYTPFLEHMTQEIGHGSWRIFVDDSHRDHVISEHVIEHVIAPYFEN